MPLSDQLIKTLQTLVSNEIGKVDALWDKADSETVDPRAVTAMLDADELAVHLKSLMNQAEGMADKINERLVEQFALAGMQNITLHGKTVYKHRDIFVSAKVEHREELVAWARENGLDDLCVLQPQRFKSWCKEHLECEDGEEAPGLPEELIPMVNIFEKYTLRIRKA